MNWLNEVKWDAQGLVPVIAQEKRYGRRAHVCMDEPRGTAENRRAGPRHVISVARAANCGSRARNRATCRRCTKSRVDCDQDVVLLQVTQQGHEPGIACHTGRHSCFFRVLEGRRLESVDPVLKDRKPSTSRHHVFFRYPDSPVRSALARLASVIEPQTPGGDPEKSYVSRLLLRGRTLS